MLVDIIELGKEGSRDHLPARLLPLCWSIKLVWPECSVYEWCSLTTLSASDTLIINFTTILLPSSENRGKD